MADSAVAMALTGKVAPLLLSGSAGLNAIYDAKERGASDREAVNFGITSAVSEALFEALPVGRLFDDKIVVKGWRSGIINTLAQMFTEGSEEVGTSVFNSIADAIIMGDKSEINTNISEYMTEDGYSREEAEKLAWRDYIASLGLDFLGGFVSGGLFGAADSTGKYIQYRTESKKSRKSETENEDTESTNAPVSEENAGADAPNVKGETLDNSAIVLENNETSYPYDEREVIDGYENAVDDSVIGFINKIRSMENPVAISKQKHAIGEVSERFKNDVRRLTNTEFDGEKYILRGNSVNHVDKRHGKNGAQDHSMANDNDFARIGWVLDNYDTIEIVLDNNGNPEMDSENRNSDGSPSYVVKVSKKINGTYFVVEAVPVSSAKAAFIKSAYISKNGIGTNSDGMLNIPDQGPQLTPEAPNRNNDIVSYDDNSRWNSTDTTNSIPQTGEKSNSEGSNATAENNGTSPLQNDREGGTIDTGAVASEEATERINTESKENGDGREEETVSDTKNAESTRRVGKENTAGEGSNRERVSRKIKKILRKSTAKTRNDRGKSGRLEQKETAEAFEERALRNGYQYVTFGSYSFALKFSPKNEWNARAKEASEVLESLGFTVVVFEGDLLSNRRGISQIHYQGVTSGFGDDLTIFISANLDVDGMETAYHEAFHAFRRNKNAKYHHKLVDIISSSVDIESDAFENFVTSIADLYSYEVENVSLKNFSEEITEEFYAWYIGSIYANKNEHSVDLREYIERFSDVDNIKAQLDAVYAEIKSDVSNSANETENEEAEGVITDKKGETNGRLENSSEKHSNVLQQVQAEGELHGDLHEVSERNTRQGIDSENTVQGIQTDNKGEVSIPPTAVDSDEIFNVRLAKSIPEEGFGKVSKKIILALRKISRALGVDIILEYGHGYDGFYDSSTRTIHINVNAVKPIDTVIRHEVIHLLSREAPKEFGVFRDFVIDKYIKKYGEDAYFAYIEEKKAQYKQKTGREVSDDVAHEELCADVGMDMLASEEDVREFVVKHRNVAERVLDAIKRVIRAIGRALGIKGIDNYSVAEAYTALAKATGANRVEVDTSGRVRRTYDVGFTPEAASTFASLAGQLDLSDFTEASRLLGLALDSVDAARAKTRPALRDIANSDMTMEDKRAAFSKLYEDNLKAEMSARDDKSYSMSADVEAELFSVPDIQTGFFEAQIDNWLEGNMKSSELFDVGDTPEVLLALGADELPVVMTQDVMSKITGGKHNISLDEIKHIPYAIADPIMVFESATVDNAFVILTELTDKMGNDVVVAMHLNRTEKHIKINRISSVYGKQNVEGFVESQIKSGNLKYINKNKSLLWSQSRGLQLPKLADTTRGSIDSILHKEDIVNNYFTQDSENDSDFVERFSFNSIVEENASEKPAEKARIEIPEQPVVYVGSYRSLIRDKEIKERFEKGKNGDVMAAMELAHLLVDRAYIRKIWRKYGTVHFVPVIGEDGTSKNMIPEVGAYFVAFRTGNYYYDGIRKTTRNDFKHKTAGQRFNSTVDFAFHNSGPEDLRGKRFVIFDDCITTGKTVVALRDFIEANGGEVVGFASFAKGNDHSDNMAVSRRDFNKLVRLMGKEYEAELSRLTERQAKALLSDEGLRKRLVSKLKRDVAKTVHEEADGEVLLNYSFNNDSNGIDSESGKSAEKKIAIGMSDSERYDILKDKEISVVHYDREKLDEIKKENGGEIDVSALEEVSIYDAKKIIRSIGNKFNVFKNYFNSDIELHFNYSRGKSKESVEKQERNLTLFAQLYTVIDSVIENAIAINVHDERYTNPTGNVDMVFNLVSVFENDRGIVPVRLVVKTFTDNNFPTLHMLVSSDVITEEIKRNNRQHVPPSQNNLDDNNAQVVSVISIADLFANVNPIDGDFIKYIPDHFLSNSQLASKEKALAEEKVYIDKKNSERYGSGTYSFNGETIPKGENPARDVDVPVYDENGGKVSRSIRTVLEAEATPDYFVSDILRDVKDGVFSYEVITDEDAGKAAAEYAKRHSYTNAVLDMIERFEDGRVFDKNDIAIMQTLYNEAPRHIDFLSKRGSDGVPLIDKLVSAMVRTASRAGQNLQAQRLLKRLTPQGMLYDISKAIRAIEDEISTQVGEYVDSANRRISSENNNKHTGKRRYNKKQERLVIDPELQRALLEAETLEKAEAIRDKILDDIADQIMSVVPDKMRALRYFAMLFNPRTHVRNVLGNLGMAIVTDIKDLTGGVIEGALGRVIPKEMRTKTIVGLRPERRAQYNGLKQLAKRVFEAEEGIIKGESDRYDRSTDNIYGRVKAFNPRFAANGLHKALLTGLNRITEFSTNTLEAEDIIFLKARFIRAFSNIALARGYSARDFENGSVSLKEQRSIVDSAAKEAQRATYREANTVAEILNDIEKKNAVLGFAVASTLPFKKTPANIMKRGFEYSPAGLITAVAELTSEVYKAKRDGTTFDYAGVIEKLSRGLTGSALFALGAFLAAMGLLSGGDEDDEKLQALKEARGEQNYSLVVGDTYNKVRPTYYDITLSLKEASDEESVDMVDIIIGSSSYLYDGLLNSVQLQTFIVNQTNNWASWSASIEKAYAKSVQKIETYFTK